MGMGTDPGDGDDKSKNATNSTTAKTEVTPAGNYFKNLTTGEVKWADVQGKIGDQVSLKGSKDTWDNLGNTMSKDIVDAVGGHIMNGGGFKAFLSYYENEKFGEKFFFDAASSYYPDNSRGFMSVMTQSSDVKEGLELSRMTHDWIDVSKGGWTKEKNALEHNMGMFLISSKWGTASSMFIGFGNEMRGLLVNDRQSGNMLNALSGQPANGTTDGPTAFEWKDMAENSEGRKLFSDWSKNNPNASKSSTYLRNLPKVEASWKEVQRSWKTGLKPQYKP